eukprot:TRINITY_DN19932_c0_g1_i2.p1 TRINITY_DN19932_c0_g1~~TRINITY_DN19932_c0_g1_i2.p1  ORF type:complete len:235 (+),score=15.65 TRINITY_DN19932_c0_g1_i2:108-812(+)
MIVAQTSFLRKLLVICFILACVSGFSHVLYTILTRGIASLRWQRDHPRSKSSSGGSRTRLETKMNPAHAYGNCLYWRNTKGCVPGGQFEFYKPCREKIRNGASGYCQCKNHTAGHSTCAHEQLVCADECKKPKACDTWVTTAVSTPDCQTKNPRVMPLDCIADVPSHVSGYCQCGDGERVPTQGELPCGHSRLSCGVVCEASNRTHALLNYQLRGSGFGSAGKAATTRRRRWMK